MRQTRHRFSKNGNTPGRASTTTRSGRGMARSSRISAFGTLALSFWPYMVPFAITIDEAAAPHASLAFMFWGEGEDQLPRFAEEVAPAVRAQVAAERGRV